MRLSVLIVTLVFCAAGFAQLADDWQAKGCGPTQTCYEVLGVARNATNSQIKKAYRDLSKTYHPDKNKSEGAEVLFKQVSLANDILGNPITRSEYDQVLALRASLYVPPESPILVSVGLVAFFLFVMWVVEARNYDAIRAEALKAPRVKRALKDAAAKQGQTYSEDDTDVSDSLLKEALSSIDFEAEGWTGVGRPDFQTFVLTGALPKLLSWGATVVWAVRWLIKFTVLRQPHGHDEEVFLTRNQKGLSQWQWERLTSAERDEALKEYLKAQAKKGAGRKKKAGVPAHVKAKVKKSL